MAALIKLSIGKDGELALVIDKHLWEDLSAAVASQAAAAPGPAAANQPAADTQPAADNQTDTPGPAMAGAGGGGAAPFVQLEADGSVRVFLTRVSAQRAMAIHAAAFSEAPPCPPVIDIEFQT
jgi:hypothetical protein